MPVDPHRAELTQLAASLALPLPEIPARYFYDDRGAQLFDQITVQPEYYQTRTEIEILRSAADDIMQRTGATELVELGSGVGVKIQLLLDAQRRAGTLKRCVMLDVNQGWLDNSKAHLLARYPGLEVALVLGDFTQDLGHLGQSPKRLVVFLAGTFGNLHPGQASDMLRSVAATLGSDGAFLLGIDLEKDPAILEAAYNDAAGVTAAFNRNMLTVLNHRFGGTFDPQAFDHVAFYDRDNAWIEMRLRARQQTHATVPDAGFDHVFQAGDELRTELSCKYSRPRIQALAQSAGLQLHAWYTDEAQRFAVTLLKPSSLVKPS